MSDPLQQDSEKSAAPWLRWKRVLFRFAALFWTGYILQSDLVWAITAFVPPLQRWLLPWPVRTLTWPVQALTRLLASHVFHLTGIAAKPHETGSGDTALSWIGSLALVLVALVGCIAWTIGSELRGKRLEYRTMFAYLHLALRFSLAATLLGYGFSKIFDVQFSPPGMTTLNERYGDSSPMALLWTFMGYSVPYTVASGVAEFVPGILLLFRRTATLGALIACAVFVNVVALNFCYDVPVKLYSSTLLLLSLFLLGPDIGRLWGVFIQHRAVALKTPAVPKSQRRQLRITHYCLQALVIASLLYVTITNNYHAWWSDTKTGAAAPQSVQDEQSIDGDWVIDSSSGWAPGKEWVEVGIGKLRYGSNDYIQVTERNGSQWNVLVSTDASRTMHFLRKDNTALHWTVDPRRTVALEGLWLGQPAKLTMRPAQVKAYKLNARGFHWVQEYPFNH